MIEIVGVEKGMFVTIGGYKILAQSMDLVTNKLHMNVQCIGKDNQEFPGDCIVQCRPIQKRYVPRELDYSWKE